MIVIVARMGANLDPKSNLALGAGVVGILVKMMASTQFGVQAHVLRVSQSNGGCFQRIMYRF